MPQGLLKYHGTARASLIAGSLSYRGPQTGVERGVCEIGDRVTDDPRMTAAVPVKPAKPYHLDDPFRRHGDDPLDGTDPT